MIIHFVPFSHDFRRHISKYCLMKEDDYLFLRFLCIFCISLDKQRTVLKCHKILTGEGKQRFSVPLFVINVKNVEIMS